MLRNNVCAYKYRMCGMYNIKCVIVGGGSSVSVRNHWLCIRLKGSSEAELLRGMEFAVEKHTEPSTSDDGFFEF